MREPVYTSDFADVVREARYRMGLTQREASSLCDLSMSDIADIERGHNLNPTAIMLAKLHKGLGIDPLHIIEAVSRVR